MKGVFSLFFFKGIIFFFLILSHKNYGLLKHKCQLLKFKTNCILALHRKFVSSFDNKHNS